MLLTKAISISLVSAFLGGAGLYVVLRPEQHINETQAAVMAEYLNSFCRKDDKHDKQFLIGQAAAMSRIVVKAKIGELALVEYAKCKAGL